MVLLSGNKLNKRRIFLSCAQDVKAFLDMLICHCLGVVKSAWKLPRRCLFYARDAMGTLLHVQPREKIHSQHSMSTANC
eukprot:m.211303 g.211303  ORF g.211303 m.211303 type:complete len:79 (-) comp15834_c0_seq2:1590-1826(-)